MKLEIELDIPEAIIVKHFKQELKTEAILLLFGERKDSIRARGASAWIDTTPVFGTAHEAAHSAPRLHGRRLGS